MSLEKYNQNFDDEYNARLKKYERPEDELDASENARVSQRERLFSAEGGFRDLLKLKTLLWDISSPDSIFSPIAVPDGVADIIDDPKKICSFGIRN